LPPTVIFGGFSAALKDRLIDAKPSHWLAAEHAIVLKQQVDLALVGNGVVQNPGLSGNGQQIAKGAAIAGGMSCKQMCRLIAQLNRWTVNALPSSTPPEPPAPKGVTYNRWLHLYTHITTK